MITSEQIEARREKELSLLFFKTMTCPVCGSETKWRTNKSGKLRADVQDFDLRQKYIGLDVNKYHVICCTTCGYSALERYFTEQMTPPCVKNIKASLESMEKVDPDSELISYTQAFPRYRRALQCAIGKGQVARASEQAYICLKTAWLLRGEQEELIDYDNKDKANEKHALELKFLQNSYNLFVQAKMTENYPMCGMDQSTMDYLVAAIAVEIGNTEDAMKLLSHVITSLSAGASLKDKARRLKEQIIEQKAEN